MKDREKRIIDLPSILFSEMCIRDSRQVTSPAVLHFKTSSREILLSGVCRLDAEGKTSSLTGWSCQARGTALPLSLIHI